MRQVDADELKEALSIFNDGNPHYLNGIKTAREIIDDAPTIEAEPVRRGKWSRDYLPSTNGGAYEVWRCSECQNAFNWRMNYCGHCGAKMEDADD